MSKTIDRFQSETYDRFFSLFASYDEELIGILSRLLIDKPGTILDLACGVGLSTKALSLNFKGSEIVGVDIDPSLISLAEKKVNFPNTRFRCCEISKLLEEVGKKSFDIIFVKSAYHYFEDEISLPYLKKFLRDDGAIVVAERTARSADSYPLPEIASAYWKNIFSEPRPDRRVNSPSSLGLSLFISCYGKFITVPKSLYIDAVRENQLVGLWMLQPHFISAWIEQFSKDRYASLEVLEEFWLYVYRNK
ncbi:MAG: class I SAM-dependent methyltransferase [Geitlerinemataceae cyanobacterium]